MTDLLVRHVQAWSRQEGSAVTRLTGNAQDASTALWASFGGWYSAAETKAIAQRTLQIAEPARANAGALGLAYMREVIGSLRATGVPRVTLQLPAARLGADMVQVYSRPAKAYRDSFATTGSTEHAFAAAMSRLIRLLEDDVMVARRDGEHQMMRQAAVERYRRIIHPELAKNGSCGLCIVASDRIYKISNLMPIHGRCNCSTAPITSSFDPGDANKVDLGALYEAAGSTGAKDLVNVRVKVNHHGELGPVLTKAGEHFTGPDLVQAGNPADRARHQLQLLLPVLAKLEQRKADGEDVTAPLDYQRRLIARLRATAAAAA